MRRDNHDRTHTFAGAGIRHPDDRDVGNGGMGDQRILDLEGRDVLRVANHRVFEAASDAHISVGVDPTRIAGPEPTVIVERVGVQTRVHITGETLRALQPQFTFRPDPDVVSVAANNPHAHAGNGRADRVIKR